MSCGLSRFDSAADRDSPPWNKTRLSPSGYPWRILEGPLNAHPNVTVFRCGILMRPFAPKGLFLLLIHSGQPPPRRPPCRDPLCLSFVRILLIPIQIDPFLTARAGYSKRQWKRLFFNVKSSNTAITLISQLLPLNNVSVLHVV